MLSWRTRLTRADTSTGWDGRRWMSEPLEAGFGADQAIASWNLDPGHTAVIEISARAAGGDWHPWLPLAEWGAAGSRRSISAVPCGGGAPAVDTDVLVAADGTAFDAVRLRITFDEAPEERPLHLAAVSFSAPDHAPGDRHAPGSPAAGDSLSGAAARLRPLSQRAYPARDDIGGGGPVWCSPTSLTMVMDAWQVAIPESIDDAPDGVDPRVPWVARETYDTPYDGTGNWSFNAAVAGGLGMAAVVTRLRSLEDARTLTAAGIPLITSIRFADRAELAGADYDAPTGHLVVVRGLTPEGDVLVVDPANPGGDAGLRTYARAQFDAVWARSRRTAYLVTPRGHVLPSASDDAPW
jgi:hypothetical protein